MRVEANTLLAEGRAKHSAAFRIGLLVHRGGNNPSV